MYITYITFNIRYINKVRGVSSMHNHLDFQEGKEGNNTIHLEIMTENLLKLLNYIQQLTLNNVDFNIEKSTLH